MSVILLTGDQRRHRYVANRLAERIDLEAIVVEEQSLGTAQNLASEDQRLIDAHFAMRDAAEARYFGPVAPWPLAHDRILAVPRGSVNDASGWVSRFPARVLLLYGTSKVGGELLTSFEGRVVNMHLGLSPYYRGTATNFWPLVNGEPECVGVTVHLATDQIDGGPILIQGRPDVLESDSAHDLGCRTIAVGADLLAGAAIDVLHGRQKAVTQRGGGRYYRTRDFCASALRQMQRNFDEGMLAAFLAEQSQRLERFPIVR